MKKSSKESIKQDSSYLNLILILISTLFTFFLVEMFLRFAGIGYGNSPIEANSQTHHLHPKNYEFLVYSPGGEYGGFEVYYNEKGYRVKSKNLSTEKDKSFQRIAFFGDSFTEATQVRWKESFVGLIESKNTDINIRNYGVISYSPIIYIAQMLKEIEDFHPTDIVVQIFENDFSNDWDYIKRANSQNLTEIKTVNGQNRNFIIKVLRYSYVARLLRKVQLQFKYTFFNSIDNECQDHSLCNHEQTEEKGKDLTYKAILLLKDIANRANARFFIYIIPNHQLAMQNQCCESDSLATEFREFSESNDLNFIDLSEVFGKYPEQSKLFFEKDGHFTPLGHSLTAKAISTTLELDEK